MRTVEFPPSISDYLSFKANSSIATNRKGYQADPLKLNSTEVFKKPSIDQFISQNKDLLSVIDHSSLAKNLLKERKIESRDDLKQIIAEVAESSLTGESKKFLNQQVLKEKTVLSSLIILNPSEFKETINQNSELAKTLAKSDAISGNETFEKLAEKAKALFESDHPLNDSSFLSSHPEVSSYLLSQSQLVATFQDPNQGKTLAAQFKSQADSTTYQTIFNEALSEEAANAAGSAQLNADFFAQHLEIAKYVVASQKIEQNPTLGRALGDEPELLLGKPGSNLKPNISNVLNNLIINNSKSALSFDSPLQKFDFKGEGGLAIAITESSELRSSLNSLAGKQTLQQILEPQKIGNETENLIRTQYSTKLNSNLALVF